MLRGSSSLIGLRTVRGHKLLALLFAYICIGACFVSTILNPRDQPQRDVPESANLFDPCRAQGFLLDTRHSSQAEFRKKFVLNDHYRQAVWQELAPIQRGTERFVLAKNWAPYAPQDWSTALHAVTTSRRAARLDVVLALQCSPDRGIPGMGHAAGAGMPACCSAYVIARLPFISALTEQWKGPFALAIYIPAPIDTGPARICRAHVLDYLRQHSLRNVPAYAVSLLYATGEVPNLHCDVSAEYTGFEQPYVDREAFRRRFAGRPWTDIWNAEYPVNELRTLARNMVREDIFIFLSEADFMVPHDLHRKLTSGQHLRTLRQILDAWIARQARRAVILPAFERLADVPPSAFDVKRCAERSGAVWLSSSCFMYGEYDVPVTKASLRAMVDDGRAVPFYQHQVRKMQNFAAGHACYYPQDWLDSTQPYEIAYTNPCEPYFIALAATLPPFEPRFKGRIRDKVSILSHMAAWGFIFSVDPDLFVVHLPHAPAVTLTNMSADVSVHVNMMTAPFALTHSLLERAALEPHFAAEIPQVVPNVGIITAHRPVERQSIAGIAAAHVNAPSVAWTSLADSSDPERTAEIRDSGLPLYRGWRRYRWTDCKSDYGALVRRTGLLFVALALATAVVMRT